MTTLAPGLWGIPVVQSTIDRGVLFPTSPLPNQRVQNLETGQIERWTGTIWVPDFGQGITPQATRDGSTDDRGALATADAAAVASGQAVTLHPGTYRVGSNITMQSPINADAGVILKPDAGVTVTLGTFTGGPQQYFDVSASGSAVTVGRTTSYIYSEWWGAHAVASEIVNDDTNAAANTRAVQAATNCLDGNTLIYLGMYTVNAAIAHPNTSFVLEAGGATVCGLKPATTTPNVNLFDFTNCNGPQKVVTRLQGTGPQVGVTGGGSAFYTSGTNGLRFETCWARAMGIGFRIDGSFISGYGCEAEFCTTSFLKTTTASPESYWDDFTSYKSGQIDLDISGDCVGMAFGSVNSSDAGNGIVGNGTVLKLNGAVGLVVDQLTVKTDTKNNADILIALGTSSNCVINTIVTDSGRHVALLQDCVDLRINSINAKNATGSVVYMVNSTTQRCSIGYVKARGALVGLNLDATGPGCSIGEADIEGCGTGMILATEGVALRNVNISGSTTADVTCPLVGTLGGIQAHNVTIGTPGDWSPAAGKVTYHFDVLTLGRLDVVINGSPENVVAAPVGSVAHRIDGGAGTSLYVKESGSGDTGWVGK